ncbi:MAG: hypothetical protein MUC51_01030 [Anaerolineae bacterium]|nr:hypothetical protein [Anaerolineae bacterium]
MQAIRLLDHPIVVPHMDDRMGANINGPSLIRVPEWIEAPLGKYYLYFAAHNDTYLRLAYADALSGPWRIYGPGVLHLAQTALSQHIASPDVHVDERERRIRMYFHGCCVEGPVSQVTCVATSTDGLQFTAQPEHLGAAYWRVFEWESWYYTLEMPGQFRRSRHPLTGFEPGPHLFTRNMRHSAVLLRGHTLHVLWSNAGDCPERIWSCAIDLRPDWFDWQASAPSLLLQPEMSWEGADLPLAPSKRGLILERARQLRDPAIFEEDGRVYLLYSVAGEHGIAIAEVADISPSHTEV